MRLIDLSPRFYRHSIQPADEHVGRPGPDGTIQWGGWPQNVFTPTTSIAEADRVMFLCPKCFTDNGGSVGTHKIAIDFIGRGTPDEACIHNDQGQPVRWSFTGTCLEDLALSPSIQILSSCAWHGFVYADRIETC